MGIRRVAIVGASVAGLTAAETLRRIGFLGQISLIGDERHLPYDRPPLSKQVLRGQWTVDQLALRAASDIQTAGLDLRLGTAAASLDTGSKTISLTDGTTLEFDGLIIATGVRPRLLPASAGLEGVHTLRRVEDALRLRDRLRPGRQLVVVGAGFLGAEVAATANQLGVATTLIEPAPVPLALAIGAEVGQVVSELHTQRGVNLITGVAVSELMTEDRLVRGVVLTDGSVVPADEVLVSIGSVPNTEWLEGSGLSLENGVMCDRYGQAAEGVYAAGDVASWYNPLFGEQMRIEHRTNAAEQAIAVARNLLANAGRCAFGPVPYFWSDLYDTRLQAYGYLRGHEEAAVVAGSLAEGRFIAGYRTGDRLVGVVAMNIMAKELNPWRSLIAAGATWSEAVGSLVARETAKSH